jgi:hypothetical protein
MIVVTAGVVLLSSCAQLSPYAGQETRHIKSLSPSDINGYLAGQGMGFAKPAELNGYPGPMHVLELADRLQLSNAQREETALLLQAHKAEARELGRQYIEAEAELERIFASREVSAELLQTALARSADLHRRIRESHLATHLKQTAMLTPAQVREYSQLRGYAGNVNATH